MCVRGKPTTALRSTADGRTVSVVDVHSIGEGFHVVHSAEHDDAGGGDAGPRERSARVVRPQEGGHGSGNSRNWGGEEEEEEVREG